MYESGQSGSWLGGKRGDKDGQDCDHPPRPASIPSPMQALSEDRTTELSVSDAVVASKCFGD